MGKGVPQIVELCYEFPGNNKQAASLQFFKKELVYLVFFCLQ